MNRRMKLFIGSLLIASFWSVCAEAATRQELNDQIMAMTAQADEELGQDMEVLNAIALAISPPLSLTVATVGSPTNLSVDIPVYFKANPDHPVSSIQFDIANPAGVVFSSVEAGIAAKAANKGVQGTPSSGGFRVIIFGVNQDAISSGPVAILKAVVGSNPVLGKKAIAISAVSASSPDGLLVPLTSKNGSLTVR